MINEEGDFVGQVCHIEAVSPGGQRHNPTLTKKEINDFNNLILLCHAHHRTTDNVKNFPVDRLRSIKNHHEAKYKNPEVSILRSFEGPSEREDLILIPDTIDRLNRHIYKEDLFGDTTSVPNLVDYANKLKSTPQHIRAFYAALIDCAMDRGASPRYRIGSSDMCISAIEIKHGLRVGWAKLEEYLSILRNSDLASLIRWSDDSVEIEIKAHKDVCFPYHIVNMSRELGISPKNAFVGLNFTCCA